MKRFVSLLLAMILVFTMLPMSAFAEALPNVTLAVNKDSVAKGETVILTMKLDGDVNSNEVAGWQFNFVWDSTYFAATSATVGDAAQSMVPGVPAFAVTPIVNYAAPTTSYAEPYACATVTQGNAMMPHYLKAGTIATLTLTAKEDISEEVLTKVYIDFRSVMNAAGTSLNVLNTDAQYEWGENTQTLPDASVGYSVTVIVPHDHAWSENWSKDETDHWKTCSGCEEVDEKAAHIWDEGVVTTPATETSTGVKTYTCTVCGQTKNEEIPVLEHIHNWSETWSKDETDHWKTCSGCEEVAEKTAHTWDEGVVTTPATETSTGVKTYTCTVCGQTKNEEIPALEHIHNWSETWSKDETDHWKTCSGCEEVAEKAAHTWNEGEVTTEPTEATEGIKTYTCTVCAQTKTEAIDKLPVSGLLGDADNNGKVNNIDAMLVLQHYAGLVDASEINEFVCDVDGNDAINNIDAMLILQHYAGLITVFPVAE